MDVRELSLSEIEDVGAGRFTQVAFNNFVLGLQSAPTLNVSGGSFFVLQAGAQQFQSLNAGNIA